MNSSRYGHRFERGWKNNPLLKDWIRENHNNPLQAYCRYCKCFLPCRYSCLIKHTHTRKHQTSTPMHSTNRTQVPELEAALSLYFCQHGPILPAVEHLSSLLNKFADSRNCQQIRLNRTKCSKIVQTVLSKHFREDLSVDIGESSFSIFLRESSDIEVVKLLGIVIKYYSLRRQKIVSTFLALVELSALDKESILNCLKQELEKFHLNIKNLIGIGADNAYIIREFNQLKEENPNLIVVKSFCSSIHLAVRQAVSEALPRNLEFLVQETYNWFSKSSSRMLAYKNVYETINSDNNSLNTTRMDDIRWLSMNVAVKRILNQWTQLGKHFDLVRNAERCFSAETLHTIYQVQENFIYLTFLSETLSEIDFLNMSFQNYSSDLTKTLKDLEIAINSLIKKICDPDKKFKIEYFENHIKLNSFLGCNFEAELKKNRERGKINFNQESDIRQRCIKFCVLLLNQLIRSSKETRDILAKFYRFSFRNVKKIKIQDISPWLEQFGYGPENIHRISKQLNDIKKLEWNSFSDTSDTTSFWLEVLQHEDSAGNKIFKELAEFSLQMLCLPKSNTEDEQIFSHLNLAKSKLRNRSQVGIANAILNVKYGLRRHDKCCFNYKVPERVLNLIRTTEYYTSCHSDTDMNDEWIDLD